MDVLSDSCVVRTWHQTGCSRFVSECVLFSTDCWDFLPITGSIWDSTPSTCLYMTLDVERILMQYNMVNILSYLQMTWPWIMGKTSYAHERSQKQVKQYFENKLTISRQNYSQSSFNEISKSKIAISPLTKITQGR